MSLTLTIAIGTSSFLILVFMLVTFNEKTADNSALFLMRLLLTFFFLSSLVMLAKSTIDDTKPLMLVNETTIDNTTTYTYDYIEPVNPNTTARTFYKSMLWIQRLFWGFVFLYLTYLWLVKKGLLPKNE